MLMFVYGVGILPLFCQLKGLHPDCVQLLNADDFVSLGSFKNIVLIFNNVVRLGLGFGYVPNPFKYKLILHPQHDVAAKGVFQNPWTTKV